MNRIYKTIWNAATQSWTVAGELASAKGKSASKTVSTLAALSMASVLGVSSAMAADNELPKLTSVEETPATNIVTKDGRTIIIINNDSKNSVTTETNREDGKPKHIIVVGSQNKQVYDGQILIGYEINSPAAVYGKNGKSAGKAGDVAIGHHITLGGSDGSTAGDKGKNVQDSFSTAIGYGSQAVGPVVAMGVGARSDMRAYQGWDSVKDGVVSVGAFALGANNQDGSVAVGALSASNYEHSVSIGTLSGAAGEWEDRGLGEQFNPNIDEAGKKKATYEINEGAGNANLIQAKKGDEGAFLNQKGEWVKPDDGGRLSVGYKAGARGKRSTALGLRSLTGTAGTLNGAYATAIGVDSHAVKSDSIAIGNGAISGGLTADEQATLKNEITRLEGLRDRAKTSLEMAQEKLKEDGSAENKFKVASATAALERIKLALTRAQVDLSHELSSNKSNTINSIAIGAHSHANNESATALGFKAKAKGQNANAFGTEVEANGDRSNAIGYKTTVGKTYAQQRVDSTAIGTKNTVDAKEVMVLGNNVEIDNNGKTRNGAVVLGHNSTGKDHTVKAVNSATVGKTTYAGFKGNLGGEDTDGNPADAAGDKQGRFVSIGKKGEERQIKHVAAGEISANSTDAINGSQLYGMTSALDTRVTKNEDDIKNLDGRVTKNEGDIKNINAKLGDITTNVTNLDNRAWTISDGTNENPIKDDKVTFKGENGVTVSLDKDSNTVTIKGGLTDADKQNIANDISNNIENVLNNKDVGFAIKQNGKNTLDANGNPLTKTEKVTPKDTVNFKNGNGTTVKAVTKKGATPTASDETSISVDVDGIKFTDKNGNNVVRDDNGDYVKADANGNPTGEKVDNKDVIMNINNPAGGNTVINNLQVNGGKVEAGSKDAVNGDQLHKVAQQLNQNNHALNNKIDGVDKRASRGIATAGAMGMLPQPHISGRSMMAAATTSYRGQQSLAVGYSRLSDNGKHIIKFSGASNLAGKKDAMVGAAYGYQW